MAEVPFLHISHCLEHNENVLINVEVKMESKKGNWVIDNHIPNSDHGKTKWPTQVVKIFSVIFVIPVGYLSGPLKWLTFSV